MIGCNRVTTVCQRLRQIIHLAARVAVDNTGLFRVPGDQLHSLIDGVLLLHYLQKQIGPVKTGNKSIGPRHPQNAFYILLNPGGRCCRERHTDSIGQTLAHLGKLAIFRAKIMAPLRDAVRFINSQTVDAHTAEHLAGTLKHQRLWCHIEKFEGAIVHFGQRIVIFAAAQGTVEQRGTNTQ